MDENEPVTVTLTEKDVSYYKHILGQWETDLTGYGRPDKAKIIRGFINALVVGEVTMSFKDWNNVKKLVSTWEAREDEEN